MTHINQIILSANEDPTYIEFWPIVSWAYKRMYPDVTVHLAFLTNREEDDPYVTELRRHGKVTLFKPVSFVPEFGQAKMIRFILASQQGSDVCYIDDIDLFPLRKDFIEDKVSERPAGNLLCVGGEVYDNNGCYPVSQMTAEGDVWKRFINPNHHLKHLARFFDIGYESLMRHYEKVGASPTFDRRENICIPLDWSKDDYFSDERFLRRLIYENPIPKWEHPRGYSDYLEATIDRHTWNKHTETWEFDRDKLKAGGYVNAHGIRPYKKYEAHYAPLIEYIEQNYPA